MFEASYIYISASRLDGSFGLICLFVFVYYAIFETFALYFLPLQRFFCPSAALTREGVALRGETE